MILNNLTRNQFPNLKGIFRAGVGKDNVPAKEAEKKDAGVGKKGKARNKSKKKSIPVTKKTSRKSPGDSWEEKIKGISGKLITNVAKSMGHQNVHWVKDKLMLVNAMSTLVEPGDIVITMGAGDIWRICDEYVSKIKKEEQKV